MSDRPPGIKSKAMSPSYSRLTRAGIMIQLSFYLKDGALNVIVARLDMEIYTSIYI